MRTDGSQKRISEAEQSFAPDPFARNNQYV